jgi:hypothetical protein
MVTPSSSSTATAHGRKCTVKGRCEDGQTYFQGSLVSLQVEDLSRVEEEVEEPCPLGDGRRLRRGAGGGSALRPYA